MEDSNRDTQIFSERGTTFELSPELVEEEAGLTSNLPLMKLLIDLCQPLAGYRKESQTIRASVSKDLPQFRKPTNQELKVIYFFLSKDHQRIQIKAKNFSTTKEERITADLIEQEKIKVYSQFLIGPYFVDIFLPHLSSKRYTDYESLEDLRSEPNVSRILGSSKYSGVVLEVNGGIHNDERKMRKDHLRRKIFEMLQLIVLEIENPLVWRSKQIKKYIKGLKQFRKADSRTIQNQLSRIYLSTIAFLGQDEVFLNLFGVNKNQLKKYQLQKEGVFDNGKR